MTTVFAHEHEFDNEIAQAHHAFGRVPTQVIQAIIATESGFDPQAYRNEPHIGDASRGLMQLLLSTARAVGYQGSADNLFLPAINVYYGTALLAQLYDQLRDWDAVFSAYNGGVRPQLGYGARVTAAGVTVCAERNDAGQCVRTRAVPVGEFANQAYVDTVHKWLHYFVGGGSAATPAWLLPIVLTGAGLLAWRFLA